SVGLVQRGASRLHASRLNALTLQRSHSCLSASIGAPRPVNAGVLQQLAEGEFKVVHDQPSSFATRMPHFGTRLTVSKSSSNATVRRPFIERIDRLWERPVPYVGRTNGATWFFSGFTNCRRSPKA